MMTLELNIPNMACSACSNTITQAIKAVDPEAAVAADLHTKRVAVTTQASEPAIKDAVTAAGYSVI